MNIKPIITITIAILLALLCSLFVFKNNINNPTELNFKNEKIEFIENNVSEDFIIDSSKEVQAEITEKVSKNETPKNDSDTTQKLKSESTKAIEKNIKIETLSNNSFHEASITEEVPDYGIMKDENGNIIITRSFKTTSPVKYSFRDFGIIDKISSN